MKNNDNDMQQLASLLRDRLWRLNNLYKIVDKDGNLVLFKPNSVQTDFINNMHNRNLILKARQMGLSTVIDILMLDAALFRPHINCGIIAQDRSAAGDVFRTKVEIPLNNLPDWLKPAVIITRHQGGSTGGRVEFAHGSSIAVATSFRSGTIHFLHITEHGKICAKYPDKAREIKTGTLPAVPDNGVVCDESTAEGVGGDFYDMCMDAISLKKSGITPSLLDYKFHFFPWWQDERYSLKIARELILTRRQEDYFTGVEKACSVTLTDEQKHWYIQTEKKLGDEMRQEYPSTPGEAFLTSGRRVFSAADTLKVSALITPPAIVYDVEPVSGKRQKVRTDGDHKTDLSGYLMVWELPGDDTDYATGADVAEGLESGDYSSFDIINRTTGEQVAHWHGHLDPSLFASLLSHIGRWYNTAFIMPERNNHGHAVIARLRDCYPVSRIYTERHLDRETDNARTPRLGWNTTRHSKPLLIDGAKTALRSADSGIRWAGTLNELESFIYHPDGSTGGQTGTHDDQAMSWMLAKEAITRMPEKIRHRPDKSKPKHWMNYA